MVTVSFVIPVHNAAKGIKECLEAIYHQTYKDVEVIVVDDYSTDNSVEIIREYPCKLIQLEKNQGPAKTRNIGVSKAVGKYIMFVDSDAVLNKDSVELLLENFKKHPDLACASGVFSKQYINKSWFGIYRELQLYWWHLNSNTNASVFILTGGMIKRTVFDEIGGFDEKFKKADIEDYEFGHRIAKKYKMMIDHRVILKHHEFASPFFVLMKKLFKRSLMWVPLFVKQKKFESNYATKNRAVAVGFAFLTMVSIMTGVIGLSPFYFAFLFLALFILSDYGFYILIVKEKGLLFLVYTIMVHFIMQVTISVGILTGFTIYPFFKKGIR